MADKTHFWKAKTLHEMNREEWESLCDGCGRCCLQKLEDEDSGDVFYTDIVCRYFDEGKCSCSVYRDRHKHVPTCIWLQPDDLSEIDWLPSTCAYKLVYEGTDLPDWHPLISGTKETVHAAQISIRNKIVCETLVPEEEWEDHIIDDL